MLADCVDVPSDVEAYARNRAALNEGLARLGYEYIEPVNQEACIACCMCARICPDGAIEVYK